VGNIYIVIAALITALPQLYVIWQNHQLKQQNGVLAKSVNGLLDKRVISAEAAAGSKGEARGIEAERTRAERRE
jgi:hypothetical protein